jgi:hypothetical protein
MKNGFVWLREGGVNKRKVTDDPDRKTWWRIPRLYPVHSTSLQLSQL